MSAATAPSPAPRPAPSPPAARRQWYLGHDGTRSGPYLYTEIVALAGDENLDAGDLVWRPGFRGWVSADRIAGLLSPPPLPMPRSGMAPRIVPQPAPQPQPQPQAQPEPEPQPEPRQEAQAAPQDAAEEAAPQAPDSAEIQAEADQADNETHLEWARAALAGQDAVMTETDDAGPSDSEAAPQGDAGAGAAEVASAPAQDAVQDAAPTVPQAEPSDATDAEDADQSTDHDHARLRNLVGELATPAAAGPAKSSYIDRHWRGELSFSHSLLVNGVLLTAALCGIYEAIQLWAGDALAAIMPHLSGWGLDLSRWARLWHAAPLWLAASARLVPWFAAAVIYTWSIVGIFRSAAKHR